VDGPPTQAGATSGPALAHCMPMHPCRHLPLIVPLAVQPLHPTHYHGSGGIFDAVQIWVSSSSSQNSRRLEVWVVYVLCGKSCILYRPSLPAAHAATHMPSSSRHTHH
jgi:hypothetical protein